MAREGFIKKTRKACADEELAEKLHRATDRQGKAREEICRELENREQFRELAADLRDGVLEDLQGVLSGFVKKAEEQGVRVHRADNAQQARAIIRNIGESNGVRRVVKSKSMLTEEIDLTPCLEQAGMEVVETDLGEFIIQLAGQRPSHIVIPAVHMSAEEVAGIFREKIGYQGEADPEALTRAAREYLRGKFQAAQMGISGVNFALAEEGSWVICTNEGNGRYVSCMPKLYVAVMGMERILQDRRGLAVFMKMLARFATGQRITQYVNLVRGPLKSCDAPEQTHLVIVDNGRSQILDGKYRKMLRCIRCGACLNVCPVFKHIGGQSFPGCYSGPMGSVLLPLLQGLDKAGNAAKACTLCGLCMEACPVKIPLRDMLVELRGDCVEAGLGHPLEKLGMKTGAWVLKDSKRYGKAKKLLRFFPHLSTRWPKPAKKSFFDE